MAATKTKTKRMPADDAQALNEWWSRQYHIADESLRLIYEAFQLREVNPGLAFTRIGKVLDLYTDHIRAGREHYTSVASPHTRGMRARLKAGKG
jgi:hypothetical protein